MPQYQCLTPLNDTPIPDDIQEIIVVSTLRNEITRLPYLLDYYRNLGVKRFFFVDDNSTDGTTEYLLAQPDAHVFKPNTSYSQSRSGSDWQNEILDIHGIGHWTLVADADELLVYPGCETMKLPEFCALLDKEGSDAVFCYLLDMYPNSNLSEAVCVPGKPFYEICNYFDKDYQFLPRMKAFSNPEMAFPETEVIGGPRLRTFYPEQKDTSLFNRLKNRVIWKIFNLLEKRGVKFKDKPHNAPTLFKVPLVKWKKGYERLSGHNIRRPDKLSSARAALLHFKFFADFHDKAKTESSRAEHYAGGQEYKRYLNCISKDPDICFMYSGSVKYTNTQDLLKNGLISIGSLPFKNTP